MRSSWVGTSTPVTGSSSRYRARPRRRSPGRGRHGDAGRPTGRRSGLRAVEHPDPLERRRDGLAIGPAGLPERPQARVAAHHRHVPHGHRERPVHELGLRDVGDPTRRCPRGGPEDLDRPGPRLEDPGDQLEERRLAAAVRPEDREERAGRDLEIDVLQSQLIAVAGRYVPEADGRCGPFDDGLGARGHASAIPGGRRRSPQRAHELVDVPVDDRLVAGHRRVPERVVVQVRHDRRARLGRELVDELGRELALGEDRLDPGRLDRGDELGRVAGARVLPGRLDGDADDRNPILASEIGKRVVEDDELAIGLRDRRDPRPDARVEGVEALLVGRGLGIVLRRVGRRPRPSARWRSRRRTARRT